MWFKFQNVKQLRIMFPKNRFLKVAGVGSKLVWPAKVLTVSLALFSICFQHASAQHGHGGNGTVTNSNGGEIRPGKSIIDHQPLSVYSTNGVLNVDLVARYADVILNNRTNWLRTFNGKLPGPTLHGKPGDTLRIRLINRLPEEGGHGADEGHGGFNTINLHTHGLNVSPEDNQDNVLIELPPGKYLQYEIKIPTNHPTGTFWYHPHKHGAATAHVGSGMTGNILLGAPDDIPGLEGFKDVQLLINELPLLPNGEVPDQPFDVFGPTIRKQWTVNGEPIDPVTPEGVMLVPTIPMKPGEVQRWRFTHAGFNEFLKLNLEGNAMHMISFDGITIPKMQATNDVMLGPGNRMDVLVQAPLAGGKFLLKKLKNGVQGDNSRENILAMVVVEGTLVANLLPMTLNPPTNRLPDIAESEIVRHRNITFEISGLDPGYNFKFSINNKLFDAGRVDQTMMLNTAEEWTLRTDVWDTHPFHIHVNWFQVVKINGKPVPPRWQDTVIIPQKVNKLDPDDGTVTIRHRFQGYPGKFVIHCHILPHEDIGMMSLVEVVDPENPTALQKWRRDRFNSLANEFDGADYADPDGDGIPNFLDFALGHRPNTAAGLPVFTNLVTQGFPAIAFGRHKPANNDVVYQVQKSFDLVQWTEINITNNMVGVPVDYDVGAEQIVVRSDTPSSGPDGVPYQFLRVRATRPVVNGSPISPDLP